MLGLLFAVLLIVAVLAVAAGRRREAPLPPEEAWRESLREPDEPLDIEEIRRAEADWESDGGLDWEDEDESWRG